MYPVSLNIDGQLCVVVGGGTVAERKVSGLLEAGARVRVVSPQLTPGLRQLAEEKRLSWQPRAYIRGDLIGARLVFAATDNSAVQQEVMREAQQSAQLVNVIDAPEECTFQVPAVVRHGDLLLTVSTCGSSPAVAARIRKELESHYGSEYAVLLKLMSTLRQHLQAGDQSSTERKKVLKKVLHNDIVLWIAEQRWDLVRNHLRNVLGKDTDFDISQLGRDE